MKHLPKNPQLESELENERSQALVRCGVASAVLIILAYLATSVPSEQSRGYAAVTVVAVFWGIAIGWAIWVWRSRRSYAARRVGGLIFDVSGTTAAFILANHLGAFFYPVYQWIIIGHGVRYGKRAMLGACALAVGGFALVVLTTPYWQANLLVASGLLVGLIILPLYLMVLMRRLQELNQRLKQELRRTYHTAIHDQLTGLTNRQYFSEQLGEMIDRAAREQRGLAVVFIDLDEFKHINDDLGHNAGDEVLQIIAARLKRNSRDEDIVSRFGGDEFALILNHHESCENVEPTIERLIKAIREPISINDTLHHITGSVGVSLYPGDGNTPDLLTHRADVAMYQAKHGGKNAYLCYSDI